MFISYYDLHFKEESAHLPYIVITFGVVAIDLMMRIALIIDDIDLTLS